MPLDVSLVIPLYNESARFYRLQEALREFETLWPKPFQVILVNDGSTDGTPQLLENTAEAQHPGMEVRVVHLPSNMGKGYALKKGVMVADRSFVLTLDADMATRPIELMTWQRIDHSVGQAVDQVVIGSRRHPDSKVKARFSRRILGAFFNAMVRSFTSLSVRDTQCGFKLYPRELADGIFSKLTEMGWAHDIEILLRCRYMGVAIKVLPVTWEHVGSGKINVFRDGIKMVRALYRVSGNILRKGGSPNAYE